MKYKGIPIRFLGNLVEISKLGFLKELIAREMIARVASKLIRQNIFELRTLEDEKLNENSYRKVVSYHFNSIFSSELDDDCKSEWRVIIRKVDDIYDCKMSLDIREKIHMEGLVIRILDLFGVKLNIDMENIDLTEKKPFLPQFFKIQECRFVADLGEKEPFKFFNDQGDYFHRIGKSVNWWLTSGSENSISLFFRSQAYQFSRLVKFQNFNF